VVRQEPVVLEMLRIPAGHAVAAHLGVGWPAKPHPTRLRRNPVADFATVDYFDGPKLTG
jgi:hypothetical protein